jgi:NhaA family Na+:H+ antiporter
LGVLYLLGPKVPIQLKVFLTALAIIDDLGAVLVVAFFYTSEISISNLAVGGSILTVMFALNKFGVRNVFLYGLLGIGGVWLAFLLSGVHATIAAVLSAFAIPSTRAINKEVFLQDINRLTFLFKQANKAEKEEFLLSADEENIIGEIQRVSNDSISPLQRLEHVLHPIVVYLVMPIFAIANAGVILDADWFEMMMSPVSLGIILGLILGKVLGIYGLSMLGLKMGLYELPPNLTKTMIFGVSLLAAIGFTMSLFINSLAFDNEVYVAQAKMGILSASVIAGLVGYLVLRKTLKKVSN